MSGGVVSKSSPVLVRPCEPVTTTGSSIHLLPCDLSVVGFQNTALLVFSEPIPEPAASIQRALSRALVHYQALAGRFVDGCKPCIACTAEGLSFVAATASPSLSVEDVKFFNATMATAGRTLLDDLAIYYPANHDNTGPLVLVQVTEFSGGGGGFVVGVTWNHVVADGVGIGQFMRSVGDLARGLPSAAVDPVRWDESVAAITMPSFPALRRIFSSLAVDPLEMPLLGITVPGGIIAGVVTCARCTVFEAITAVLWQCRTRAVMSDPEAPTLLCFSVDLRKHAGAKDGYYGNCSALQRATATSGEVASAHITELVNIIRRAKDQIPEMLRGGGGGGLQHQEEVVLPYNLFIVTYWRNLGLDEADFGGGKPARVLSYRTDLVGPPYNIVLSNGEDGGCNVLSRCVKKEHAHAFLQELATFTA